MVKRYFKLEKKYLNFEKSLVLCYLYQMKRYLEKCEVMEVFNDNVNAFQEEFHYITKFINNCMILRLPQRDLLIDESDEHFQEKLKNDKKYYEEYYGENKKYYKYIEKIRNLLLAKILH